MDLNQTIHIDLISEPDDYIKRLSEFAADIDYIPLQTTKNSLIGPFISKIVNVNSRIYIKNSGMDGEILCFDLEGQFLFKINNKGRGPEEYTFINDFDVSYDNNLIILSSLNHRLLFYEIIDTGFSFRKSILLKDPTPYRVGNVPKTQNTLLAIPPWRGTELTLSLLIGPNGDTINLKPNCFKYKMVRKKNFIASSEMLVYSIGDMVCFKEEFSDTVYSINAKSSAFIPRLIFDTHGTLATPEMRGGTELPANITTRIDYVFETSRYIFCWYWKGETLKGFLIDRSANKKFGFLEVSGENDFKSEILKNGLMDDLSGGPDFYIEFRNNFFSNDKIFSLIDAISLKNYIGSEDFIKEKNGNLKKKNELKQLADSLCETDNPVLIIVTPKR